MEIEKILENWMENGGDLSEMLDDIDEVNTEKEAILICKALRTITFDSKEDNYIFGSPCHYLSAFFQSAQKREVVTIFRKDGLPQLRRLVDEGLKYPENRENDLMFLLKILTMYQEQQDIQKVIEVAKKGMFSDEYMWSVIFGMLGERHKHWKLVLEGLREHPLKDFICISYLDFANRHAITNAEIKHPFDTDLGYQCLKEYLLDLDESNFSYACSAVTALPFLSNKRRSELMKIAQKHPDTYVQIESAWVLAKTGDVLGLETLIKWAKNINYSKIAIQYLKELGCEEQIPKEVLCEDFQALTEMTSWLSHPNEFGKAPDHIEQYDSRTLHWPPTNDKRKVWLFKYTYAPVEQAEEKDIGIAMVGSVTFALLGEATAKLSPEEVYGLHCAWELEMNNDARSPEKRTPQAGLEILRDYNKTF